MTFFGRESGYHPRLPNYSLLVGKMYVIEAQSVDRAVYGYSTAGSDLEVKLVAAVLLGVSAGLGVDLCAVHAYGNGTVKCL